MRAALYTHHDAAAQILEQAIEAALKAAHHNDIRAMAMPAIGAGVFAFPPELAAEITAKVLAAATSIAPHLECIRVCVASELLRHVHVSALMAKGLSVSELASASV